MLESSNQVPARSGMAVRSGHWSELDLKHRCRIIGRVGGEVSEALETLIFSSRTAQRTSDAETVSAELIPFAAACRQIAKDGPSILSAKRWGWRSRPVWLWGVRSVVERVPIGKVLVIGAWNYPILLAGVQAAQALAAGNRVLWKPAPGCERLTQHLAECFYRAGVPEEALTCLPSDVDSTCAVIDNGVDLIVLTGSASTGRAVLRRAAERLTPTIMELSGCDAMVILPTADLQLAARALRFGLSLNSGATCIAPRRIFVHAEIEQEFRNQVVQQWRGLTELVVHPAARSHAISLMQDAVHGGAHLITGAMPASTFTDDGKMLPSIFGGLIPDCRLADADIFAPVAGWFPWSDETLLTASINTCRYALGTSLFGAPAACQQLARRLEVGSVVVNDLIVPTADPRIPFGGRRESGFGQTRGREGLLAMTTTRVISTRRGGGMPHLGPNTVGTEQILRGALRFQFGSTLRKRLAGLQQLVRGVRLTRNDPRPYRGETP